MSWPPAKGESFDLEDDTAFEGGDVVFADGLLVGLDLPPAGRVLRRGGPFRVEDVLRIPSLRERLGQLFDDGVDLGDPDVALLVPPDDVTRFCLHHGIELERALRLLRGQQPYRSLIREGLLQALWLNLIEYQEGDPERVETGVAIPVAELHCPHVEGCQAAYEIQSTHDRSAGLKLQVRGRGAGGGLRATLHFEDRIETDAACGQVTVPADLEVVPWIRPDDGARIDVVSLTQIAAGAWSLAEIPADRTHLCAENVRERRLACSDEERRGWLRQGVDYFTHELRVPGKVHRQRVLETARSFTLGFGALLELESQFTRSYAYGYDVVAVAEYLGFFEDRRSEVFFWAWGSG